MHAEVEFTLWARTVRRGVELKFVESAGASTECIAGHGDGRCEVADTLDRRVRWVWIVSTFPMIVPKTRLIIARARYPVRLAFIGRKKQGMKGRVWRLPVIVIPPTLSRKRGSAQYLMDR